VRNPCSGNVPRHPGSEEAYQALVRAREAEGRRALVQPASPGEVMERALRDPARAKRELISQACADDLYEYVRRAWPILEPAVPMKESRAMRAICSALQAVTEGRIRRLLVNVPPGFSKSLLVNVFWPSWEWGPRGLPHYRYINASYEQGLATRDLIRSRDLVLSSWYQSMWPLSLKEDQNEKTFYANSKTGWRKSTSVGGALIGYRGDRICVDDPHDVKRAESAVELDIALRWWTQTLPTRFNDPERSALVLIMQRLNINDCSGHVISKTPDGWAKIILPMEYEKARHCRVKEIGFEDWRTKEGELLWPEMYPREAVDRLKADLSSRGGTYAVAGQLQQRPRPADGGLFPRHMVSFTDADPGGGACVRGWDLAASEGRGDYTAGVRMRRVGGRVYVLDVRRFRGSARMVELSLRAAASQDGGSTIISVPQDPGQAGKSQKNYLAAALAGFDVRFSAESGSKRDRARPLSAQWEAGNVVLVRGAWNDEFLGEMELFTGISDDHDDQADAASRAFAQLVGAGEVPVSLTSGYAVEGAGASGYGPEA